MDWVGILVERASHLKLGEYMQQYIFEPLHIRDLSTAPSQDMKQRLAGFWRRQPNGTLSPDEYILARPLTADSTADFFHSGGAGLFGNVREFASTSLPK